MTARSRLGGLLCALAFLVQTSSVRASDLAACVAAAEQGQLARDAKAYARAREHLLACSAASCPAAIRNDCLAWLDGVERAFPTAVFFADAGEGQDVTDVRVTIDDVLVSERLDGRSVSVEPGERRVRFLKSDGQVRERRVLFVEGEKNRKVDAHFDARVAGPPEAPASSQRPTTSAAPWVAAGLGILGAAGFVGFGLAGKSDIRELDRCEPRCESGDVDAARTKYLLADISLGLALVGLGVATYLFVTQRSTH